MSSTTTRRQHFRNLHHEVPDEPTPGILVMPNPFDVGSARVLAECGALALATTSAGFAGTLGRSDQQLRRDDVIAHAEVMAAATELPLNVDTEDCYGDTDDEIADTARQLAATAAAGFSIEDYDPRADTIRSIEQAAERVAVVAEAGNDLVLTARAENHLYGVDDLDDTIRRLIAYRDAGADCLYAPGVTEDADIDRVVREVEAPINVLALAGTPPIPRLAELGVARVSVGSSAAWAAYGAIRSMATELFGDGTSGYASGALSESFRRRAFD